MSKPPFEHFDVFISNGGVEAPEFEVITHIFGQVPVGDAHNELVIQHRDFIEQAISEKLERERERSGKP